MAKTTFTTLDVSINYNKNMLTSAEMTQRVVNTVTWLVRDAELTDAENKVAEISKKVGQALTDGKELTGILTKDEKETWEDFQTHKKMLEKFIANTGYSRDQWDVEDENDKVFFQLIALPNMPKKFAKVDLVTWSKLADYMDLAEKYYASATAKVDPMKNKLEYDFFNLKKGGVVFRGVKVKPNATDTKKFLALFIKDLKLNDKGVYDFSTLYGSKQKSDAVKVILNKFLALYIVNRMDAVEPMTEEENKKEPDKQEENK